MYIRGTRTPIAVEGLQGPRGMPSTECYCSYRKSNICRYITEGGNRCLSVEDRVVVINSMGECKLYLPEAVGVDIECSDYYYCAIRICVYVSMGCHSVRTIGKCKINGYLHSVELDKQKLYTFISTPTGEWLQI